MAHSPRGMRPANNFTPRSLSGLALWLDASQSGDLYTTDAGPVVPVSAPTDIAGCALWLDGADSSASSMTLSGSLVGTWKDKSGNGRDATAAGAARPTLTASGLNSKSVVTFDGANTTMLTSDFTVAQPHSIFIVGRRAVGGVSRHFCDGGTAGRAAVYWNNADNWAMFAGAVAAGPTGTDTNWHVFGAIFNTISSALRLDGFNISTANPGTNSYTGLRIGGFTATQAILNGSIAELIAFDSALSTADRARVEAYLASKWGITGVHANATAANDPVGYWRDRSGNSRHVVNSTATKRPLVGSENSRKALTFDGVDDNLNTTPSSTVGASAVTHIAVVRNNLTSQPTYLSAAWVLTSGGAGRPLDRWQTSSQNRVYTSDATATDVVSPFRSLSDRFIYCLDGQKDGVATNQHRLREFINGAQVFSVTGNSSAWSTTGQKFNIGTRDDNGTQYKGNICEVLCYDRLLTTAERQRLERYLAARWGITLAPQASNADAQDWINRVYANGGSVTASTANAVNQFCVDLENAGLRSLMYRLNLFCGTGLNACLVPLYRGPSLGGTQYGNTTDTNVGPFVSGDYAETGASGGLTGNGTSKYLNLGIAPSNLPTYTSAHMAVYHSQPSGTNQTRAWISCQDTAVASAAYLSNGIFGTPAVFGLYLSNATANYNTGASQTGAAGGMRVLSRTSATRIDNYYNAVSQANSTTDITGGIAGVVSTQPFFVFANNNKATADQFMNGRIMAYSVGVGMSQSQIESYTTAMQAFQTALTRNV